jgi:hypothetical protein
MKIIEIRNLYKEKKFEDIKIEGNKYIPLTQKIVSIEGYDYEIEDGETEEKEIIHNNGIMDNVIIEIDEYFKVDIFLYEIHLMYAILKEYSDIDFDNEEFTANDYDMFMNLNQYECIYNSTDVKNFISLLEAYLNNKCIELNSFSKVISKGVNKILLVLNDLTDSKKLDSMLKVVNKAINKNPALKDYMKTYVDQNGANK